jgi:hypothetical protein
MKVRCDFRARRSASEKAEWSLVRMRHADLIIMVQVQ